jgi:hypothetical protein
MTPDISPTPDHHPHRQPTPTAKSTPPGGALTPGPTAELTALAAHLRRLAERLDDLDTRSGQLTDTLTNQILPQLNQLRADTTDQLAHHTRQVQHLLDTLTPYTTPPADWSTMDADQAATEWDTLAHWIAHTLVPWHDITRDQLPDCWALHRPAVLELAWLHHTHRAAHQPGAPAHLTAEWHTRFKPAALHAIRDAIPRRGIRTCGPGHHLTTDTQRIHHQPTPQPPPYPADTPATLPTNQLAERHHWQHLYTQAVTADLSLRQTRNDSA